ncbi:hypothetical protein L1987_18245 [Smallanthus sonchifolius]|uniref:Uncharacterized protein n=1 Tax=Smallanthus sonchifolius TaxID=185202 RepID=A0ACB9J174_9ASTR|nr:hypothetical protein L1987_18245 [Smallanthus sonchifolius]
MGTREKDRDLERLIPANGFSEFIGSPLSPLHSDTPSGASSSPHNTGREAFIKVIRSWASKKFITGCVILSPIAITFYVSWWFIQLGDWIFSPIYALLGFNIFGLGFITTITFIFFVGVFMSSWLGTSLLSLGEFIIKKMPLMSYIYTASKQISAAISPGQGSHAFKEVAIIKHPSVGEYAIGFITSTVILRKNIGEELCCVYVPTNHLYLGDIVLVNSKDVMKPNISVREGIEIIISGGMSMPKMLTTKDSQHSRSLSLEKFAVPHNRRMASDCSHESGDPSPTSSNVREDDRFLPIPNISWIMKKGSPENGKISKDTIQECVSEFIGFITSEASAKCQKEKRKTINGDDMLWPMATLGV